MASLNASKYQEVEEALIMFENLVYGHEYVPGHWKTHDESSFAHRALNHGTAKVPNQQLSFSKKLNHINIIH
jgi:hypothetical protein